ncbi:unnamed protein product [Peniophora sp. CBMAI 1063]|nr:unnamed protein product [Peniophora sp. CBMAI 1063]
MSEGSSSSSFDLSLPIADLLRQGTAQAHHSAETSSGAGWLTRGELDREEYVRFLIMLYHVYHSLEQALERHSTNNVLAPTYNPTLLSRAPALLSDIAHLLDVPLADVQQHTVFASTVASPPPAMSAYAGRIASLSASREPAPLLAHAYVRYLGDLSGGQVIRRRVARAYGLEEDNGAGVSFYEFGKLGGGGSASIGDMKKIKEWYREGMNAGVGDDRDLKVMILAEANKAFEFNNGLFASLKPPSTPPSPPLSPIDAEHHLGDPRSPTEAKSFSDIDKYSPLQLPKTKEEEDKGEGNYTTAGVISFILAMCLAHFVLVVGGFTGSRGWEKYVAVREYLAGILG